MEERRSAVFELAWRRWGNEPILTALLVWDDIGIFDFLCWGDFETPEVFDVLLRGWYYHDIVITVLGGII